MSTFVKDEEYWASCDGQDELMYQRLEESLEREYEEYLNPTDPELVDGPLECGPDEDDDDDELPF